MSIDRDVPKHRIPTAIASLAYRVARRLTRIEFAHVLRLDLGLICPPTCCAGTPLPPLKLEYRFLDCNEVRAAAGDPNLDLDAAMAPRLQSERDFCFAAFHGGRLVNYAWYALESVEAEHSFGAGLKLPPDTIYMYKAYTVPEFRGRQIHGAALSRAAERFRQRGIARMIAIVEFGNRASLRSHRKLGFRPAGRLLWIGRKSIGWGCGELLS